MSNKLKSFIIFLCFIMFHSNAQVKIIDQFSTPYGDNEEIGKFVKINGAKIYYEEYGSGEPLLLIHGNGGNVKSMGNQIDFFKSKYRVIIADNRGQGKSEMKTDSLTYTQITKDWEGLVTYLKLDSINIIGLSDGGIIGLKMGISGNTKIKKIVAAGANLRPDSTAVRPWAVNWVQESKKMIKTKLEKRDTTANWEQAKQLLGLLGDQPSIPVNDLSKITAKVLIVAGDKDIIKNEHSVEIFENIPNAHLSIIPGETHFTALSTPKIFNEIVRVFFDTPFKRPDSNWTKW